MDEGRLTDSYGRMVDFKNTVVIMTSNIGTRQLKEFGRGVGFATQSRLDDKEFSRSVIQKALNKSFAPEFINRIDEIITFDQLSLEAITKIIDIELKGLYERIESIGYKLIIDDEAKRFVAEKGYDVQFGARPLKRAIQTYLEDGLSELIITSSLKRKRCNSNLAKQRKRRIGDESYCFLREGFLDKTSHKICQNVRPQGLAFFLSLSEQISIKNILINKPKNIRYYAKR